jgi:hypothetical protein
MLVTQLSIVDWFVSSAAVAAGLGAALAALRHTGGRMLR